MSVTFVYDSRLGISIPELETPWNQLNKETQSDILDKWESVRGHIPDRIKQLEGIINDLQAQLYRESDFKRSCELNSQIAETASVINDLWIWYRTGDEIGITV